MRIVHINLHDQFNDTWSYQDNLLPRMHKQAGHEVTLITTCKVFHDNGAQSLIPPSRYTLPDGVQVIRLQELKKFPSKRLQTIFYPYAIFDLLCQLQPQLLMVHGLSAGYADKDVIRYLKKINPSCTLVLDSHTCEINDGLHLYGKLRQYLIRKLYSRLEPYSKKVFGITPACADYAAKYYGASREKVDVLPLGYDPGVLPWEARAEARAAFRQAHGLQEDDIVVIHGGKIIRRRKTPEVIQAVAKLEDPRVKLVIFGGMDAEMKPEVEPLLEKHADRVLYLGSLTPQEYHKAYYAADIALFPGGQSVLWQQAIGCGLALLVGNDKDLDYLDRGGNTRFLDDTTTDGVYAALQQVLQDDQYLEMKQVAATAGREFFSYRRIANQVTELTHETV